MSSTQWLNESHNIVDIIHGVIPYNGLEYKIMENAIFMRLHRVLQSSLAYLTYPSNKVHRYEHSIGVMYLSGEFFFHSICNSTDENVEKLIEEVGKLLRDWLRNGEPKNGLASGTLTDIIENVDDYLYPVKHDKVTYPDCALYRKCTPANLKDSQLFIYYAIYEATRLVGLLHDVGHLPYSHITEFALNRLYHKVDAIDESKLTDNQKSFLDTMSNYIHEKKTKIHEVIGQNLVNKIFSSIIESLPSIHDVNNLFIVSVFYLAESILSSKDDDDNIFSDLHRIVDGIIDCDRMDYCCRDLYCSGVSKEFPRYERIFNTVQIYYRIPSKEDEDVPTGREKCCFVFSSKALGQIEALLLRRWEDFTTINYHHSVHKHELLLELVICELGYQELSDTTKKKQNNTGILPFEIASLWDAIQLVKGAGAVDIIISQLDDEWLNTLLKYKYFQEYGTNYSARKKNRNKPEWNRLDELITGEKHYCSLFKRSGGFHRFDASFYQIYCEKYGEDFADNTDDYFFDSQLQKLSKESPEYSRTQFYEEINDELAEWIKRGDAKAYNIIDCFLDCNDFSPGIKASDMESIFILSSLSEHTIAPSERLAPLKERSIIDKNIESQKDLFPSFHVYYLPRFDIEHNEYCEVELNKLQQIIAEIMVDHMQKVMNSVTPTPVA